MADPVVGYVVFFALGVIVGAWGLYYSHQWKRMIKTQDEFEKDRSRIRAELEKARQRMTH